MTDTRIGRRNATFQQWQALLGNRAKRHRSRTFLVQGVRPIDAAVAAGWPLAALLHGSGPRSAWAEELLAGPTPADRVELTDELLAELGGKDTGAPEVVAVARIPEDDPDRLGTAPSLVVVADRLANPGNVGTLIRTADALGADGVLLVGHAGDPFDPQAVRASRGSLFALPVVRTGGPAEVLAWLADREVPLRLVAADETGDVDLWDLDLRVPTAVVVGSEAEGVARAWREAATSLTRIPMSGSASSLNAAVAGAIVLYEVARQRARQ